MHAFNVMQYKWIMSIHEISTVDQKSPLSNVRAIYYCVGNFLIEIPWAKLKAAVYIDINVINQFLFSADFKSYFYYIHSIH